MAHVGQKRGLGTIRRACFFNGTNERCVLFCQLLCVGIHLRGQGAIQPAKQTQRQRIEHQRDQQVAVFPNQDSWCSGHQNQQVIQRNHQIDDQRNQRHAPL